MVFAFLETSFRVSLDANSKGISTSLCLPSTLYNFPTLNMASQTTAKPETTDTKKKSCCFPLCTKEKCNYFWAQFTNGLYDLITACISLADLSTDVIVTYQYYTKGRTVFFTLSLIILALAQAAYARKPITPSLPPPSLSLHQKPKKGA